MNKEEISKSIDEELKILKQEPSFVFNMEEIKAIDYLQFCYDVSTIGIESIPKLRIALNLISKLQKELDSQKQGNKDLVKEGVKLSAKIVELEKELDKKDKVIDKMAKTIAGLQLYDFGRKEYFTLENEDEVIEYFYKKAEVENE